MPTRAAVALLIVAGTGCRSEAAPRPAEAPKAAVKKAVRPTPGPSAKGQARGVVVSCPMNGKIWGTDAMAASLTEIAALGANAVQIHPYARIAKNGAVRFTPAAEMGYLGRAMALTRAAKLEMFWKPHLSYWGNFDWRGAIEFGADEAAWKRFFDSHEAWIVDHARFAEAHQIPTLAIGVELDRTVHREKEWRRLIAAVRKVYRGKITYAANWDSVTRVPFWDALDLLGVQAYFPLSRQKRPDRAQIRAGWKHHLGELRGLSQKFGKKVLFTEVGFNRSDVAATQPWDAKMLDNEETRALRTRLMEETLFAVDKADFIAGMYWWKWIPGWAPWDRDFSLRNDESQDALRKHWAR